MKTSLKLATASVLSVLLISPVFVFAAAGDTCMASGGGPGTMLGNGQCIPGSGTGLNLNTGNSSGGINVGAIQPYADTFNGLINGVLVPILFSIAFITFLWGVYKYFILGAADEKSREEGRQFVLWGLIGFVVILSVWALVSLTSSVFGLKGGSATDNGLTPPTL